MSTNEPSSNVVTLSYADKEPLVDTRVLAEHIGLQHHSVFEMVKQFVADFEQLGVVRFQTEKPPKGSRGGRPDRSAMLNEDQCYLLLAYSRNTDQVRALKIRLVRAFGEARRKGFIDHAVSMLLLPSPMPWERRFEQGYYDALARMAGVTYDPHGRGKPVIFAKVTDEWVYGVVMPTEVHEELKARRASGLKLHQWLKDGGLQAVLNQIDNVTRIANGSCNYPEFTEQMRRYYGDQRQLSLYVPNRAA